jgi:hypothetical protein
VPSTGIDERASSLRSGAACARNNVADQLALQGKLADAEAEFRAVRASSAR